MLRLCTPLTLLISLASMLGVLRAPQPQPGGIQTIGSWFSVVTSNVRNVSFEMSGLSSRTGGAILLPSWRILQAASQEASAKTLIPYRPWYPVKGREGIRLWSAAIFLSVSSRSLIRNLALEGRQSDQSSWNDHGKQG